MCYQHSKIPLRSSNLLAVELCLQSFWNIDGSIIRYFIVLGLFKWIDWKTIDKILINHHRSKSAACTVTQDMYQQFTESIHSIICHILLCNLNACVLLCSPEINNSKKFRMFKITQKYIKSFHQYLTMGFT